MAETPDQDDPNPPPDWWHNTAWWEVPDVPKPDWWDGAAALIAANPDWYAKYAAAEAALGNPYPLIGRVHGYPINNAEITVIRQALQDTTGKQTLRDLRDLEKKLIAAAVDRMM